MLLAAAWTWTVVMVGPVCATTMEGPEGLRCGALVGPGQSKMVCEDFGKGSVICCSYRISECHTRVGAFHDIEWTCRKVKLEPPENDVTIGQLEVSKRVIEDYDLAAVPWQALWLLQSSKQECDFQEAVLRGDSFSRRVESSEWLLMPNRPEDAIGHCPVRFRSHVDPHRWLPRNLVVSECRCEGTPCAKHGLHVCVTAFAARTVFSLYTGKKRILIAVGCLCAIQKTRLAQVITPETVE